MSLDIQPVLIFADGTPVSSLNPLPTTGGGGGGGTVDQGAANGDAAKGWSARLTDGAAFIVPAKTGQLPAALGATNAAGSVSVGIAIDQLSTLATAAKQDTGNASLASIDAKLTNPLPVAVAPGNTVSAANSSTTPLGGGATFTGTGVDLLTYAGVEVFAFANVAGTLYLEYSTDNSNWDLSLAYTLTASVSLHVPNGAQARYFRVRYANGGAAQATFRLQTLLLGSIPAPHVVAISSVPIAGNDAILTQAEIIGLSSAGGGTYVPVKVAPSGAVQVGGDVTVSQSTAANLNATVAQGAGSGSAATFWYTRVTDGTNTQPTMDVAARSGFQRITDGTNTVAVKAASTAAVATDPAAVVALSSNAPSLTPALTSKSSSATSITLLASNTARKSASFYNDDANALYLREDGGAATTSIGGYTVKIPSGSLYELPVGANGGVVTGAITGIWAAVGSSGATITERT